MYVCCNMFVYGTHIELQQNFKKLINYIFKKSKEKLLLDLFSE